MTNFVFQFNPMASNNVTWLSCCTILLPDSKQFDLCNLALLVLSLLVDLGPGFAGGLLHCVTISSIHSLGSLVPVSMESIKKIVFVYHLCCPLKFYIFCSDYGHGGNVVGQGLLLSIV